jgi:hypothetical protein
MEAETLDLTREYSQDEILEMLHDDIREKFEAQLCAIKLLDYSVGMSQAAYLGYHDVDYVFKKPSGNLSILFSFSNTQRGLKLHEVVIAVIEGHDATRVCSSDDGQDFMSTITALDQYI